MEPAELKDILDEHRAWLLNRGGRRADLRGAVLSRADLRGAVLSRADLMDASGNRSEIKAVDCDTYCVTYTADRLQIGCQNHPIADWWAFDEGAIRSMDGERAVAWWARWKPLLQQIIETSPAKPTGHEAAAEPQAEAAE